MKGGESEREGEEERERVSDGERERELLMEREREREGRREGEGCIERERGLYAEREGGSDRCLVGEGNNLKTCKIGCCEKEVEEVRE